MCCNDVMFVLLVDKVVRLVCMLLVLEIWFMVICLLVFVMVLLLMIVDKGDFWAYVVLVKVRFYVVMVFCYVVGFMVVFFEREVLVYL